MRQDLILPSEKPEEMILFSVYAENFIQPNLLGAASWQDFCNFHL
jgi:hypothetical protein